MLSKPTFIVSILLFACSVGLFYFLIIPNIEEINIQKGEIADLEEKLENTTNYFNEINTNASRLEELDWDNLETKIDANFMSGPFYEYNMNIFMENLVANSGLLMEDFSIAGTSLTGQSAEEQVANGSSTNSASVDNKLQKVSITLSLVGEYDNLKKFLDSLRDQFCVVDINKISIEEYSGSSSNEDQAINSNSVMKFLLEGNIYSE